MQMLKKLKVRYIGGLIALLFLTGCSAQWHVQRAYKKDPNYFKADTVTITDTQFDTTFVVTKDTVEIQGDIQYIIDSLISDSCKEEVKKIIVPITEYIVDRECIEDTLVFTDSLVTEDLRVDVEVTLTESDSGILMTLKLLNHELYTQEMKPIKDSYLTKGQEILFLIIAALVLGLALKRNF